MLDRVNEYTFIISHWDKTSFTKLRASLGFFKRNLEVEKKSLNIFRNHL